MGGFPKQTHGIIVICNCNRRFFSVIVIDPKVIDTSILLFYYIYCCKLTKYQVYVHVIPTASNCKQCTDNS